MLILYRRHRPDCKHRNRGRNYLRCACPLWCDGELDGGRFRRSLGTTDIEEAKQRLRMLETGPVIQEMEAFEPTVEDLRRAFLGDLEARKMKPATVKRYRTLLGEMEMFAEAHQARQLARWTPELARRFRESWRAERLGAVKKLERLKTVLRFAVDQGWLSSSPAATLKPPRVQQKPTLPFTELEMQAILEACNRYQGKARQLRALVLLMRYSGLRVGDAVTLARDRIQNGRLFLYTQKTGTPVFVPLPPVVLEAMKSFEPESEGYFFWSGTSDPGAATRLWMKKLKTVFRRAGIPDGHAHRLRDTFAVSLLEAGVTLDQVSVLLGHQSVRVTEKHYAPWVESRQRQLEESVRKIWDAKASGRAKVIPLVR